MEIELRVTKEEQKQLKERKIETESKFKFGSGGVVKAEFVGLGQLELLKP